MCPHFQISENLIRVERVSARAHSPTCSIRLTFGYVYGGRGGSSTHTYMENKMKKSEKKVKKDEKKLAYMSVKVWIGVRCGYLSPCVGSVST